MTNWFVSMFFTLLGIAAVAGVFAVLNGIPEGLFLAIPTGAAAFWFFTYRYVGTDG